MSEVFGQKHYISYKNRISLDVCVNASARGFPTEEIRLIEFSAFSLGRKIVDCTFRSERCHFDFDEFSTRGANEIDLESY